jgi:hypothetical protein
MANVKKVFGDIDTDGDGVVHRSELKLALEKAGTTPALSEIEALLKNQMNFSGDDIKLCDFEKLHDLVKSNAHASECGGMAKLVKIRHDDIGKYPSATGKWKKSEGTSGFYGAAGGSVFKKDELPKKGPPPPKTGLW